MYVSVENCLKLLPERYHDEFIGDVLVDGESIKSLRKVFEYYIQNIYNELSHEEKEKFEEEYFIIKIR